MRDFSGIAEPEIFTLHDLVHRMTLRSGATATPRTSALLARAIQDAIRALVGKHPWNYYRRQTRFESSPSLTMTVTYDRTGGAQERLLTITSGATWPQDADAGEISIGEVRYRIKNRISSIQATLEADFSPSSDFTSEVTWSRRAYRFGRELAKVHYVHNITNDRPVTYLPSSQFSQLSYDSWIGGFTQHFTYQNHGNRFGSSEFILVPRPTLANTFEVSATVVPHIPHVNEISGTDMAGTQSGDSLSSATAAFDARMIGSIVRVSRDATRPTELNYEDYEFQAFVTAVPDATTLTISETVPSTFSARGYVLSSPIDIDSRVMLEALEDAAYFQYTKNHDHEKLQEAAKIAQASLLQAIVNDNKVSLNSNLWDSGYGYRRWNGLVEVGSLDEDTSDVASEQTLYLDELPANSIGSNGDQAYIQAGDLEGAIYERQSAVWTFMGIYQLALRTTDPDTSVLPTGFQYRLVAQSDPSSNGVWEWDGIELYQRVVEN